MKNDIYTLIVIYNKNCNESISYNCIKKVDGINIIVCDNSTKDFDNQTSVENDGFIYLSMQGNKGLSSAYNKALDYLKGKDGWLCIFDDDTEVPAEYFDEIKSLINDTSYDIFLPQVICNNGLMSPVNFKKYKVNKVKSIDEIDNKYIAGINSGLAVNLDFLGDYRYDHNLFLDFVDYKFIIDMREKNAKFKILDTILIQSFSGESNDKNAVKTRFIIKKKDLKYFYSKSFISKLYYKYLILRMKIKLILKFKDIRILLW